MTSLPYSLASEPSPRLVYVGVLAGRPEMNSRGVFQFCTGSCIAWVRIDWMVKWVTGVVGVVAGGVPHSKGEVLEVVDGAGAHSIAQHSQSMQRRPLVIPLSLRLTS